MQAEEIPPLARVPKLFNTVVDATALLKNVVLGKSCEIPGGCVVEHSIIGDYSYLGANCMVSDSDIGRFCAIAPFVRIGAPNHPYDRPSQHRFTYCPEYYSNAAERDRKVFADRRRNRVTVGHDVWIGHGAIVLSGIEIGTGSIIAAGAVVTRSVEPYVIVGGAPARKIKDRFPAHVKQRLLRIAWWGWPFELILERLRDFQSDVETFCCRWDKHRLEC